MKIFRYYLCAALLIVSWSCSEEYDPTLKNTYLRKTVAPAIVGETLEFAYAMGTLSGKLVSAQAEVNIAGAPGTGFGPETFYTDRAGRDIGVAVADTSTTGNVSTAVFTVDTVAATLRYYYVIPEEAKGRSVSITFKAVSSIGEEVSVSTPKYNISKMDMKRNIEMTANDACYFSLETMKAYTADEVETLGISDKIDLIYLYSPLTSDGYLYGHALVSPGTEEQYLAGNTIPANIKRNVSKIERHVFIRDMQLSGNTPAVFVDDIDLETLDLSDALDFILRISSSNSAFVESADGKYRAYIYFNSARARRLQFGIKRLEMQ